MADRDLPVRPNVAQYKKQAKELLKRWKASDPKTTRKLADAQHAIARDHGFDTWKKFTDAIAGRTGLAEKAASGNRQKTPSSPAMTRPDYSNHSSMSCSPTARASTR